MTLRTSRCQSVICGKSRYYTLRGGGVCTSCMAKSIDLRSRYVMYCTLHNRAELVMSRTLKRILMASAGTLVLAGAGAFGWYWFETGRFLESTNDAYVKADYTTIAPKVSGYIATVDVEDNQPVKAGQVLARIDDRDYQTALAQARADVASAEADIRNIDAQLVEQQSVIAQAEAAIVADQASVKFAKDDYDRYHKLPAGRVTSVQDEQRAQTIFQQQSAQLQSDRAALTAAHQRV